MKLTLTICLIQIFGGNNTESKNLTKRFLILNLNEVIKLQKESCEAFERFISLYVNTHKSVGNIAFYFFVRYRLKLKFGVFFAICALLISAEVMGQRTNISYDSLYTIMSAVGPDSAHLGVAVAGIGDWNRDGYDDVAAGVYWTATRSEVRIFFGGDLMDSTPDFTLPRPSVENWFIKYFGWSVASAGDVNGDGYPDVIVGAPFSDWWDMAFAGAAFIYLGGEDPDTLYDIFLAEPGWYYTFGQSVASAGDVNRDRYDDVVVGAPDDDMYATGRTFIYFGGDPMDPVWDVRIEGDTGMGLGWSVASAGDVNRDGYDDVVIGSFRPGVDPFPGYACVLLGGEDMDSVPDLVLSGTQAFDYFGSAVSGEDLNGDGFSDLIIGAEGAERIYIYMGSTTPDTVPDFIIVGGDECPGNGYSLAGAGDMNKDSFGDFVTAGEGVSVCIQVHYGNTEFDTVPDALFTEVRELAHVSSAGDVNRDGYDDIIVGESWYAPGKIYVLSTQMVGIEEYGDSRPQPYFFRNYPNPFSQFTEIRYSVPPNTPVWLTIYDSTGRLIKPLISGEARTGVNRTVWSGKDNLGRPVPSGIYFLRLKAGDLSEARKVLFLRKRG